MEIKLFYHSTCPHSRELYDLLKELNLLDYIEIIDVADSPFIAYKSSLISVPALFMDGKLVVSGVFEEEWVKNLFSLYTTKMPDDETIFRNFISAIIDNVATASFVYLYPEKIESVFENKEYILTTSQLNKVIRKSNNEIIEKIKQIAKQKIDKFVEEKSHLFKKVIGLNFLRELYWLNKSLPTKELIETYNINQFSHWLYQRATLGRIGIDHTIEKEKLTQKAEGIRNYILENLDELNKIVEKTA